MRHRNASRAHELPAPGSAASRALPTFAPPDMLKHDPGFDMACIRVCAFPVLQLRNSCGTDTCSACSEVHWAQSDRPLRPSKQSAQSRSSRQVPRSKVQRAKSLLGRTPLSPAAPLQAVDRLLNVLPLSARAPVLRSWL